MAQTAPVEHPAVINEPTANFEALFKAFWEKLIEDLVPPGLTRAERIKVINHFELAENLDAFFSKIPSHLNAFNINHGQNFHLLYALIIRLVETIQQKCSHALRNELSRGKDILLYNITNLLEADNYPQERITIVKSGLVAIYLERQASLRRIQTNQQLQVARQTIANLQQEMTRINQLLLAEKHTVFVSQEEIKKLKEQLASLEGTVNQQAQQIKELDSQLGEYESDLSQDELSSQEEGQGLQEVDRVMLQQTVMEQFFSMMQSVGDLNARVQALESERVKKDAELAEKNATIESQEQELQALRAEVALLRNRKRDQDETPTLHTEDSATTGDAETERAAKRSCLEVRGFTGLFAPSAATKQVDSQVPDELPSPPPFPPCGI